jgi:L-2-hydroxyglutarate oxidase LhgO
VDQFDVVVIGAGVVGLAIAAELSRTYANTLVIDQHAQIGQETSSRNSEVIHAGIYYPTHSLKAKLCVEGKHKLYQHCQRFNVPHKQVGKLLVAVSENEIENLHRLHQQAELNDVHDLRWLNSQDIHKLEPALLAHHALLSPSTGIIDSHAFMSSLLWQVEQNGGFFVGNSRFLNAQSSPHGYRISIESDDGSVTEFETSLLINAGGLHASNVAQHIEPLDTKWIPQTHYARGHYFSYGASHPFRHLIYPMPDKQNKGLGIHGTLDMGGQLRFGPDVEYIDDIDYTVPQARQSQFVDAIQRYWPGMDPCALHPSYSGIRPKLQGPNDAFKDFVIQGPSQHSLSGLINLFGIESPGLTSSLAIATFVSSLLE